LKVSGYAVRRWGYNNVIFVLGLADSNNITILGRYLYIMLWIFRTCVSLAAHNRLFAKQLLLPDGKIDIKQILCKGKQIQINHLLNTCFPKVDRGELRNRRYSSSRSIENLLAFACFRFWSHRWMYWFYINLCVCVCTFD